MIYYTDTQELAAHFNNPDSAVWLDFQTAYGFEPIMLDTLERFERFFNTWYK